MENTRTMAIQMPEETYQRLKAYLKRHQVKQKDFVTRLVEAAMEKEDGSAPEGGNKEAETVAFLAGFGYNNNREKVDAMNKAAAELSLANDFIFGEVMRQPENVKPLLEAVLEKKIAEITYIEKQQDIKDGFELHGIRLDISLEDSDKTQYAVEMQTGSAYDLERRIRYYQSSLDRRTLEVSEHYRDLKSSYVIFVCTDDYYKRGLALYRRKSVIEGAEDIVYDDGSHAYILNAQFTEPNINESAQEFLRYINAKKNKLSFDVSGNEYLTRIDRAVEDIKSDDRKVERFMTLAAKLEDVRFIALREGEEKGRTEAMVGLVKRLLKQQRSMEDISNICGLDLDEVKKIAEEG